MISSFIKTMLGALTENGALSNSTTNNSFVDAYFKFVRNLYDSEVINHVKNCWEESPELTMRLIFQTRDIRGGKGERKIYRTAMKWIAKNKPEYFERTMHLGMEYGRADDVFMPAMGTVMEDKALDFVSKQLVKDLGNMKEGNPVSLMAKWVPSEGSKNKKIYLKLCNKMGISCGEMRKTYMTPLRRYINIVESILSSKDYEKLTEDYLSKIPSQAMKKLRKALKNRSPYWESYIEKLKGGKTKVNVKAMHPHELVKIASNEYSEIVEEQWKAKVKEVRELGSLDKTIVLSDTSGSMMGDNAILVSLALGILISRLTNKNWRDFVITFESNPHFIKIPNCEEIGLNKTIEYMMDNQKFPWGGSTNFAGVFKQILNRAKLMKMSQEEMPERIVVVSDMQFDQADDGKTNFDTIKTMYEKSGYKMPQMVFWNVRANTEDFPVTFDENNVMLISGFSPTILKNVIEANDVNPLKLVLEVIGDERYNLVSEALEELVV